MSPEHKLQIAVKKWVRESIAEPHIFLAFDRSRNRRGAAGGSTHINEAARGIRAGTPDTVLVVGGRAIWIELKVRSNKPTPEQIQVGLEIGEAGGLWNWANSVVSYRLALMFFDVPLRPQSLALAEHLDARLAADVSPPKKRTKPARPRAPKPSAAQVARFAAWQRRTLP